METETTAVKTGFRHSEAWLEMRRKVRGYKTREQRVADDLARYYRKKAANAVPPPPPYERQHGMKLDARTKCWMVGIPATDGGRTRWLTTGERDIGQALKVVDASGIQRLSILARAKCLTSDAASIIMAGHIVSAKEVVEHWVKDMKIDQSRSTAKSYGTVARQMLQRCGGMSMPLSRITREQINDYVNDPTIKASTREARLAAIRSLFRHAAGFGHVVGDIAKTIRVVTSTLTVEQRQEVPAAPFTEAEYHTIMSNPGTPQFWRWATAIGYWLGLRMVDVCRLEWASIGDDFFVLYPQKTGRRLILPIHDPLIGSGELKTIFDEMRAAINPKEVCCFPERKAHYPGAFRTCYRTEYKEVLRAAGIEGKSFHGWRHSFKMRLHRGGKTIEEIAALMGHADTKVTEGYGRGATG